MTNSTPELLVDCGNQVGEGPVYDRDTDSLFWVDIPQGQLWQHRLTTGDTVSRSIGEPLGSVALIEGGGFLLATKSGVVILPRWDSTPRLWTAVESDRPTQFNDGKCDARGRFIAGTAGTKPDVPGTLYRIDHDGSANPLIEGIGMSNGIDWSPDKRFFYHVDTLVHTVTRYNWDDNTGMPFAPITCIELPREEGLPDGLSIDSQGCLWLAVWGAGEVRRYSSDGQLLGTLSFPTPNISSCAFGGRSMNRLFVTSAAVGAPGNGPAGKLAGSVFAITTPFQGRLTTRFPRHHIPHSLLSLD